MDKPYEQSATPQTNSHLQAEGTHHSKRSLGPGMSGPGPDISAPFSKLVKTYVQTVRNIRNAGQLCDIPRYQRNSIVFRYRENKIRGKNMPPFASFALPFREYSLNPGNSKTLSTRNLCKLDFVEKPSGNRGKLADTNHLHKYCITFILLAPFSDGQTRWLPSYLHICLLADVLPKIKRAHWEH